MSEKSLQVSVEDLQHIQLHLEGQEQALAAIAEHLRAFESDAGQFVEFQSDFIKTIGLIQDVHQYTKQQAQQWREQLEQCSNAHQNTLQLQADTALAFTASTEHYSDELKITLQQQQHCFEQIRAALTQHENLLSKHESIELLKNMPDSMQQMTQRLNEALIRVDQVAASLSKMESQQAQQAEQLSAKNTEQFLAMQLLLNQHKFEQAQHQKLEQETLQHQLDNKFYDLSLSMQNGLTQLQQDQANHYAQQERSNRRKWFSVLGVIFMMCLATGLFYFYKGQQQQVSDQPLLPPLEQQVINTIKSGSQDVWIDRKSRLMWFNCGLGQTWKAGRCEGELTAYTWPEAQALVKAINQNGGYAGYTDWRLPYITESFTIARCRSGYMRSIRIPSRESGNIVVSGHCRQANPIQIFWSNTVNSNSPSFAYSIDYGSATTKLSSKDQRYFVTLVRNP